MAVRRREVGNAVVLSLQGSFFGDLETDELQAAILEEVSSGNTRLVLNLEECQALNSMSIGILVRALANYRRRGGEVKLCGLGKRIQDLFAMIGLNTLFEYHGAEAQALASFDAAAGAPSRPAGSGRRDSSA